MFRLLAVFSSFCLAIIYAPVFASPAPPDNPESALKKIHDEVKEFGMRPGEDFISAEVFIGKEDDDDTNKDIHVLIMIQSKDGITRMKVQVTYMERSKEDPRIKDAKETKYFVCRVDGNALKIENADYKDKEMGPLADEILKAVKNKKKLIRGLWGSGSCRTPWTSRDFFRTK